MFGVVDLLYGQVRFYQVSDTISAKEVFNLGYSLNIR